MYYMFFFASTNDVKSIFLTKFCNNMIEIMAFKGSIKYSRKVISLLWDPPVFLLYLAVFLLLVRESTLRV